MENIEIVFTESEGLGTVAKLLVVATTSAVTSTHTAVQHITNYILYILSRET